MNWKNYLLKRSFACFDVLLQRGKVEEKSERHICRSPGPYSKPRTMEMKNPDNTLKISVYALSDDNAHIN